MTMNNAVSGRPFLTHREALDEALAEYPDFTYEEKRMISALIQRKSFLESSNRLNISHTRELAALRWILMEINNYEVVIE